MTRYERWSREGMPSDAENEKIQRGIARAMAGAIQDAYHGISRSASMIPDHMREDEGPPRAPSGGTTPIESPPGVRWIDAQCDAADRQDRLAAVRRENENRWIEQQLRNKPKTKSYNPIEKYDRGVPSFHRDKKKK